MKKIKLMLLSFCVLATVAGALAFKARGTSRFCWTSTVEGTDFCGTNDNKLDCPNYITSAARTSLPFFLCTAPSTGVVGHECDVNGVPIKCGTNSVQYSTIE